MKTTQANTKRRQADDDKLKFIGHQDPSPLIPTRFQQLNYQWLTRSAAAACITCTCDLTNGSQPLVSYLALDGLFGNKEASADQSFLTNPFVACNITVLANGCN